MKTILIYSGGLDSTVLLSDMLAKGREVKCLSVNYGQRHNRELEAARAICDSVGVHHVVADLSGLRMLLRGSSQTDASVPVPHGHYAAENMKLTVVPNRNALMLSVAFAWAISLKFDSVAYAAHGGDHAIYPDCRPQFTEPFAKAMYHADWHQVLLEAPFLEYSKKEIVQLGNRLNAPLGLSYSCYEGNVQHCGLCGTCQERRVAFRDADVTDPTTYDPHGLMVLPDTALES